MQRLGSTFFVVLAISGFLVGSSQGEAADCQYVLVTEQCQKSILALDVGGDEIVGRMRLDEGDAGAFMLSGVDFTTVQGDDEFFAFVTQGPFLHVIDIRNASPTRTIDVEHLFGLDRISLGRLDAAAPVSANQQTRYPLYVTGSLAGVPWVLVFDQEALLDSSSSPQSVLLGSGPIHAGCEDCVGSALDVAAGGPPPSGGVQEAYVSVLDQPDSNLWLRVYRLVLRENFSFEISLDPWNDEGLPWDGSAYRANGLDYDSTGLQPFGVFQTTSVVRNLSSGESSCALPGHPTDVAVWGPGSGMEHPNFHFATSPVPSGSDLLLGFPAGGCPDGGAASLAFPIAGLPRALALSSTTSDTPWIYTGSRYERMAAVHLRLSSDSEEGDRIEVIESFDITLNGDCPYAIAIRDESYCDCVQFPFTFNEAKPPKVDCLTDPEDPRCIKNLAAGGAGAGGE